MFTNVEQTLMLKIKALNTKMASFIAGHFFNRVTKTRCLALHPIAVSTLALGKVSQHYAQ